MTSSGAASTFWQIAVAQAALAWRKRYQRRIFFQLRPSFRSHFLALRQYQTDRFCTPYWNDQNAQLERILLPRLPFFFLRDPIIAYNMVVTSGGEWLARELAELEQLTPPLPLSSLLEEEYVGGPRLVHDRYRTSHNSIHHLYHLVRFFKATRRWAGTFRTVVEWGGGYGNLAKIFRRCQTGSLSYIIVDTPLFSCLQWIFLSVVFGPDAVHLLRHPQAQIRVGKINLLPVSFVEEVYLPPADLFISTWALSESAPAAQDFVRRRRWFGAAHILLAYQDNSDLFPTARRVEDYAAQSGARAETINFLPGKNYYAFR